MQENIKNTCDLLKSYQPSDQKELVYKQQIIEFISSCEDCFLRSCKVGHVTASAFLLNKDLTHVLLMHHAKLDKWMQLGGHCDGDPDVLNVALKEASEESGIRDIRPLSSEIFDIDIHLIPSNKHDEAHYHFDIRFLLHAYNDDTVHKNHESKELRWVEKDSQNILSDCDSVARMFKKLRALDLAPLLYKEAL